MRPQVKVSALPVSGRPYDCRGIGLICVRSAVRPLGIRPYLCQVGRTTTGAPIPASDQLPKNSFVINFTRSEMPRNRWRGEAALGDGELYDPHKVVLSGDALLNHQAADQRLVQGHQPYRPTSALPLP
ncbi:hypothetical protein BHE74_00024506 [Ensete ventricosum]|nr:hypothetical protein BHE74_00024506 [Ensete ventricosum]